MALEKPGKLRELFFSYFVAALVGGRKGIRPVKTEWWGAGVVICLGRGADLHNGPADATATHCLLLQLNPDLFYLSGTGSPG